MNSYFNNAGRESLGQFIRKLILRIELPGMLGSLLGVCGKRNIIFKGISFLVYSKIGHLLLHTLTIFQVSYEYLAKKLFLFWGKTFASLQARVPLMRRGDSQMPPGQRITAGVEGCHIQAISRCLSPVLMCETGHCRVTKSLCHVSFFDQCVIQINHC